MHLLVQEPFYGATSSSDGLLPISGYHSLRSRHEPLPRYLEICQPAADLQPVGVLRQPAVADVGLAEDSLDHQERMFNLRLDLRLGEVASPFLLTQQPMAMRFHLDKTLGVGGMVLNHLMLSSVGRVAPHPRLLPMQQTGLSCTLAAVAATERISLVRLSTSICAFMSKYHWFPFFA